MKRYLLIIGMVVMSGMVRAQLPIQHCGDWGYLYSPECSERYQYFSSGRTCCGTWGGFSGAGFVAERDTVVYGVSVPSESFHIIPYLWVYLLKARDTMVTQYSYILNPDNTVDTVADGVTPAYTFETARKELYCFIDRPPVPYAEMEFPAGEEGKVLTCPAYDFYFEEPCEVDSGEMFFVGIVQSQYNAYNKLHPDIENNTSYSYQPNYRFSVALASYNTTVRPYTSLLGVDFQGFPNFNAPYPYSGNDTAPLTRDRFRRPYAFMAIVRPPLGEELNPRHDDPVTPGAVSGLKLDSVVESHAMVSWDAAPASEWGPTGVNVDMYQVNYAEYRREYDTADVVETTDTSCMLPWVFDTTRYYKVRCRARCHHKCDIHDTVVWGPWGEYSFYTGTLYPDTLPLECGGVEGLHYAGLRSGMPYFEWQRGLMQTQFEVAYAEDRRPWECDFVTGVSWRMPETVRPGVEYRVRVRAKCVHSCYIHDTTMWGPWSEEVRVTTPVGVQEAWKEGTELFSLMPNPARGRVTVKPEMSAGQCPAVLTVTDAQGREVLRRTLEDSSPVTIELEAVASGTYLVTLKCRDGASGTRRLQVE